MSLFQDLVRERITPKPVPTPPQAQPKKYKNVLEYNRDNFMPKKESNLLTKVGQTMQKMPDTTLKSNVKFNQNPLVAAQGKVGEFISGLPGEMIRETGKAFELVSTKQGRGEIKKGIQDYPQEFKKLATPGQRMEGADALLKNPATLTAFGLTNIPSPKNLVKKGVQEFVEQGTKKLVKEGAEEVVEQGAKKIVKEGTQELIEQGVKKAVKSIDDVPPKGTVEQMIESAGDWIPGLRKRFDEALFRGDKETVKRLLPDVPAAYKQKFVKEIDNVVGAPVAKQSLGDMKLYSGSDKAKGSRYFTADKEYAGIHGKNITELSIPKTEIFDTRNPQHRQVFESLGLKRAIDEKTGLPISTGDAKELENALTKAGYNFKAVALSENTGLGGAAEISYFVRQASQTNPSSVLTGSPVTSSQRSQVNTMNSSIPNTGNNVNPRVAQESVNSMKPNLGTTIKPKLLTAGDPEQRAVDAIKRMSPLRKEQEALYTAGRSQKIQRALEAEKQAGGGVEGFSAKMKQMEGSFDKVTHSSIRSQVSKSDIDMLVNKINDSPVLTDFEKIPAQKALLNLFGDEGAKIPTESELNKLKQVFKPELVDELLKQRSFGQKAKSLVTDVLNVPRAIMSSGDFSAPLRQGVFAASSHPKDFARSFKKMFSYAFNQKNYDNMYKEIAKRPTYQKMRDYGLAITDMASHSTREEAFMSNLAEKIPVFGRLVRASDRAYTGFLTSFRADLFDTLYKNGEVLGKANDERYLKSLTSFINNATGRGNLKEIPLVGEQLSEAAPLLNGLFFSPRLIASRVNLLNPVYYSKLEPTVRKEALKSLVTFTTTGMTILGTAALAGADVETDPTSADFGKIKIGNTRYDIWGGFQPYATFVARMILGRQKSTTTGGTFKYGEGYKPTTRKDVAYRFAEGKASPVASFGMDALVGKDFEGNKFDLMNPDLTTNPITKRMSPLVLSDMKDVVKEYGPEGIILQIPGLFGVNTQTYRQKPNTSKSTRKSRAGTSL